VDFLKSFAFAGFSGERREPLKGIRGGGRDGSRRREVLGAAGEAVDGAELVASRAVLFLLGDGGQVGDVVCGGHGDAAHPDAGEGGVVVEERVVLGVGVDEVEVGGVGGAGVLDVAEEAAEDGQFERMEEEGERWRGGNGVQRGVGVVELDGSEGVGGGVLRPERDVGFGDVGEGLVELDAFDTEEWVLRGEEAGAAFACADIEEDCLFDGGLGVEFLEPAVEEAGEDAGRDAVVGGEFFDFDAGALRDGATGDEAGGVGGVGLVEGVDRGLGLFAGHRGRE